VGTLVYLFWGTTKHP